MDFTMFVALWVVLAAVVLALIAYRKVVSRGEEEALHIDNPVEINHQVGISAKLHAIDKWGQLLTVAAFLYGLALAAAYFYHALLTTRPAGI
jgi:hypothetical protein